MSDAPSVMMPGEMSEEIRGQYPAAVAYIVTGSGYFALDKETARLLGARLTALAESDGMTTDPVGSY